MTPLWWAGLAAAVVLAAWWLWQWRRARTLPNVMEIRPGDEWPGGISDGLNLSCPGCGEVPMVDYVVADKAWRRVVPKHHRLGVVCLTCFLDAGGSPSDIEQIQVIGGGRTVVLRPVAEYDYRHRARTPGTGERDEELPQYSDRGFKHFDPIEGNYGGSIRAYESSAASAPHIWVSITPPLDSIDPTVHLHLEDAVRLRDHLGYLIAHHYHLDVVAEPDHRRAEHLNRTLRRVEGGDET